MARALAIKVRADAMTLKSQGSGHWCRPETLQYDGISIQLFGKRAARADGPNPVRRLHVYK